MAQKTSMKFRSVSAYESFSCMPGYCATEFIRRTMPTRKLCIVIAIKQQGCKGLWCNLRFDADKICTCFFLFSANY